MKWGSYLTFFLALSKEFQKNSHRLKDYTLRLIHIHVVNGGLISEAFFNWEIKNVQKNLSSTFLPKKKKMRDSDFAYFL